MTERKYYNKFLFVTKIMCVVYVFIQFKSFIIFKFFWEKYIYFNFNVRIYKAK